MRIDRTYNVLPPSDDSLLRIFLNSTYGRLCGAPHNGPIEVQTPTIKETIDQFVSDRRCIEGLQFRLDMERRRSRNPTAACIRSYEMMMDYFHSKFHPALESVEKKRVMPLAVSSYKGGGEVIPFQKRSGKAERQE